ncbi:MAG TPA: helix-hairpin-helix domain-containing protein [Candidatus Acidoferrum sp.]|nr:helix-hairpin-helix domain-containing protein [Candidatus Acidoferrum sp.]
MLGRQNPSARFFLCLLLLVFGSIPEALAKKKPPAHPININTANSADLQQVPGIGPSTAQKILDTRKSYGSFKSVDDLLAIKGIGPKRLEKMRKYLTVGKPLSKKQPPSPQAASTPTKPPPVKSPAKQTGTPTPTVSEDEEP